MTTATRIALARLRARHGGAAVVGALLVVFCGVAAFAYWTTTGSGTGSANAATLSAPTGVTASATGANVTVNWTGVTPPGATLNGYYVTRLAGSTPSNACGTNPTTPTLIAAGTLTCTDSAVANGTYTYTVTAVFRTWSSTSTASASVAVAADATPPTQTVSLTPSAATAYLNSGTIFFRSDLAGSFTLTDVVSDAGSGPASANFPAITASGWSHAALLQTTGTGTNPKTYVSNTYSWGVSAATPTTHTITGKDVQGNQVTTNLAFAPDVTGPTGGALVVNTVSGTALGATAYSGGAITGTRTDFSADSGGSGFKSSILRREVGTLANGVCSAYGAATVVTGAPNETGLAPGCYRYTLTGLDQLDNASVLTTVVQVDALAPVTGALTLNAVAATAGGSSSTSGTGTYTGTRTDWTDAGSGIATSTLVRDVAPLVNGSCGTYVGATTVVGVPNETAVATGCYRYTLTGTDKAGNAVSVRTVVEVDRDAPTQVLSRTGTNSYLAGSTLYFRGGTAGSLTLTSTVTDLASGPKQVLFPAFSTAGWGHTTAQTVTPGTGALPTLTFTSSAITWSASAAEPPAYTVTASDQRANSVATALTFVSDSTAPTGGGFNANGVDASSVESTSYSTSGSFSGTYTDFVDAGSGLASEGAIRETASLAGGDCGSFTGAAPVSTTTETNLPTGCYRYTFSGTDNVGNVSSVSTVVMVDRTAPTQALTEVGPNTYLNGTTLYYNNNVDGSLVLTSALSDAESAPDTVTYPAVTAMGWTFGGQIVSNGLGTLPTLTYPASAMSWTAGSTSPGSYTVTGADRAGNTVGTTLTFSPDTTAPTGGSLVVNGVTATATGAYSGSTRTATWASTKVDFNADTGSGLASSVLTREFAAGTACASYGGPTVITAITDTPTRAEGCYRYTLTGTDRVGNVSTRSVVLRTFTDGNDPTQVFTATGDGYVAGTTLYYRSASAGSFILTSTVTDNESGAKQVSFPQLTENRWDHDLDVVTAGIGVQPTLAYSSTYSWTANPTNVTNNARRTITASDNANNTDATRLTFTQDNSDPTGGALSVNGTAASTAGTTATTVLNTFSGVRTDYTADTGSGVASSVLTREYAPFSTGTTCGSFGAPTVVVGAPNEVGVSQGCYRYTLTGTDRVGNVATPLTTTIKAVTGSLSQTVTLTPVTGQSALIGTTLYYGPSTAGSFKLSDVVTGIGSNPASATFPGLAGWGHTTSQNGTASGTAPTITYIPATNFTWASGSAATASYTVTGRNVLGDAIDTTLTFQPDATGPTGGALIVNGVSGTGGGATGTLGSTGGISGSFTPYSADAGAGYQATILQRAYASSLISGSCGSFGASTTVASVSEPAPSVGCYRYTLTGSDVFGNASSVSVTIQVDRTAPSVALVANGPNAYVNGSTLYYRGGVAGSFTLSAAVTDGQTYPVSATFPSLTATGWTPQHALETVTTPTGTTPTITYDSSAFTWTASPAVPTTYTVTGSDVGGNAGTTSVSFASDTSAPTGAALTVNGVAATAGGSTSTVTAAAGAMPSWALTGRADYTADTGSGLDTSYLTVASAPWSGTTCGTFGAESAPITGVPAQNGVGGYCYRYTLTGTDHVGNVSSISSTVRTNLGVQSVSTTNAITAGTINRGDTMVVKFNGPIAVSSLCSTWSNDNANQSIATDSVVGVTVHGPAGTANDYIDVDTTTAACAGNFNFGRLTLGDDGYLVSTTIQTFRGTGAANRSTIAYNATTYTLTVTLGINATQPGDDGSNPITANTVAVYAPDAGITGVGGVGVTGTGSTANVRQF